MRDYKPGGMEETLQNDTAKPAAKSYLGAHRKWLAILLLPMVSIALLLAFIWSQSTRCPLQLTFVPAQENRFHRSALGLTNSSDCFVMLSPGPTHLEARVAGKWIRVNPMIEHKTLLPFSQTLIIPELPNGTDLCRLEQKYLIELWKWRLWRKSGPTGRKAMEKLPSGVFTLQQKDHFAFQDKNPPWKKTVQEVVIPPVTDLTK